jgi:glycosyltransferase involved in cell wall biosynthesis
MSASAKVDVCVPTRGTAAYIEETLDSVLAQTFEGWSLLVSENGAGGGELEARVRPYLSDPRIHYSATGGDLGAAQNHTRLIQAGSAPYVGILHDDDRWHPGFLARRVEFLDAHHECGFVFGANIEIDEHGNETGRSRVVASEGQHAPEVFVPRLVEHNVIGIPTVLVRRSAYEAVGPEFDEHSLAFDYEMWLRLAFRFPAGYLHAWDSDYRIHAAQATRTTRRRGKERLHMYGRTEQLLAGAPSIRVDRGLRRRQLAAAHLIAALDAVEERAPGRARGHLREAVRANPRSVFDTRFAAAVAALALGARGREAFARLRLLVLRKRLRVHLRR